MKPQILHAKIRSWLLCVLGAFLLGVAPTLLTRADPQNAPSPSLLAQADEILQQMSRVTGLPIKGPLNKQVVSRPEIEKYLLQNLHEEMTPAEIHAQEALVRALGLVSPDFHLEKFLVGFYTEQAAGFYDPKSKTMFIADWIPAQMQTMVLSHELTHALQDQNWDLETFLHATPKDDDATAARQAVVEGYATAAMLQQMTGAMGLGQLPSLSPLMETVIQQQFTEFPAYSRAPYFFRMQALFPYVQGVGFIQAGLQNGGWKNLNVLFEHPPQVTRQIFAPQTYFNHQVFPSIRLAHPPALESVPGLRFLSGNTLGELGYQSLLGQLISDAEARAVGPSWLGDRYLLYEQPGGNAYTLVARTRWTTPEASLAFFRDYHTILARKYPELTTDKRSATDVFVGTAANGMALLLRKGDECVWAEGVPTAKAGAMLAWLQAL